MGAAFPTTEWSLVAAAGDLSSSAARQALETLCARYWYPVYALARQLGNDADSARDLTQGFFVYLLEKNTLKLADQERGRFRSFLRTTFRNYSSNEWRINSARKRGDGRTPLSLDFETAESRYRLEPKESQTPETCYERRWARTLLDRALARLSSEMEAEGGADRFRLLEPFLAGPPERDDYPRLAGQLGVSEGAIRVAVHRMRQRYGRLLREEVARTVGDTSDVDDELRYLLAALDA
jgi:RNA polymerase sigma factor (sigma-70 family)